ncbi:MAG: ATP-binding protein [Nitrospinota bacterium]|nr:ATP-binding protein [Nitrospinota bacterium]
MNAEKILLSYPDGVAIFAPGLRLMFANPAFEAILGTGNLSAKDGVALSNMPEAGEIFKSNPEITRRLEDFFNKGVTYTNYDYILEFTERKGIPAEVAINSIDYGEGSVGAIFIIRTVAGKSELNAEVEKESKIGILSLMAAGLAHEIKNPLGGIRGAAQLIGRSHSDLSEYSELIINETDRINLLVNELLVLGSDKKPRRMETNIHRVLDETIKLLEAQFSQRNLAIIRDYDPSLPEIKGDPDRLKQVFLNLAKNSIEMSPKGGRITLKTRTSLAPLTATQGGKKRSMMDVMVIDEGPGIPAEILKNLFTPFNTSKKEGTGLGLVISLKIIRDHEGKLTLENNAGGKGAIAKATIPIE